MNRHPLSIGRITGSFRFRIFILVAASFLLLILIFNYSYFRLQKAALERDLVSEGKSLVSILANSSRLPLFADDAARLTEEVASFANIHGLLQVRVLTGEGEVFFEKSVREEHAAQRPASHAAPAPEMRRSLAAGAGPVSIRVGDRYEFWAPVTIGISPSSLESVYLDPAPPPEERQTLIGFAAISLDRSVLDERSRQIMQESLVLIVLLAPFALLLTFVISRLAARPLTGLVQRMEEKSGTAGGEDDLEVLSRTYENLVASLRESFDTIDRLKTDLEERVRQRTLELSDVNRQLSARQEVLEAANCELNLALTRLRETQTMLVQSEKMAALGMLVAGVAHEINNTTNFISGALPPANRMLTRIEEQLKSAVVESGTFPEKTFQDLHRLLEHMEEGARRTTRIVADLRTFSRPDQERLEEADIHQCLDTTLALLHYLMKNRITLVREYAENLPRVPCYPGQLSQVFMNVLANAVQAIADTGTVTVRTRIEAGKLHVTVSDSGHGIEPAHLERIFDPFFTTKPPGQGTGLGLSISYGIIRKHRGEILVTSEPGRGSSFDIVIPAEPSTTEGEPT
ncbi:MAG: ATP-binding protein [Thermodesulfobacteriota bacterium]